MPRSPGCPASWNLDGPAGPIANPPLTTYPEGYNIVNNMASKVQKIQKVGNSAGILLPSEWLSRKGLKPGAKVRVEVTDQRIVILPEGKDREAKVDAKFARDVESFFQRHEKILQRLT